MISICIRCPAFSFIWKIIAVYIYDEKQKSLVATCHERLFLNFFGFHRKTVNLPFTPRKTASQRGFAAISSRFSAYFANGKMRLSGALV